MRTVTLTIGNLKEVVRTAVLALAQGGVIVYPTETSYGIGADATNEEAVRRVFRIKGREKGKLLSVLMASKAMAKRYAHCTSDVLRLWERFFPGALTMIVRGKGEGTIGIRVSSHPFARALVRAFGKPITATSANLSGTPPFRDPKDIAAAWERRRYQPDLIIDAGKLPKRLASTVVDCTGKSVRILREGSIIARAIDAALQKL